MRPLRVRERTLGDGSLGYSVDGSPTDAVSLAFLGYFGHGFDLVASGINYGANLGDDITYSGTVSAAMEAVINGCPAFAICAGVLRAPRFRRWPASPPPTSPGTSSSTASPRRADQRQRARGDDRGVRRHRGHPPRPAGLLRTSSSAARPARHPLLLDRRPAAVGLAVPGRTSTRSSTAGSRSRRPPRPDRPEPAAPPQDLVVGAADHPGSRRAGRRPEVSS